MLIQTSKWLMQCSKLNVNRNLLLNMTKGREWSRLLSSDSFNFERESEETLESLCEHFETVLEQSDVCDNSTDVSLSNGVLTVAISEAKGVYVINKQTPNKQIWLSSPISGPFRYDFDSQKKIWIYRRSGERLHDLLDREVLQQMLGAMVTADNSFRQCYRGDVR